MTIANVSAYEGFWLFVAIFGSITAGFLFMEASTPFGRHELRRKFATHYRYILRLARRHGRRF